MPQHHHIESLLLVAGLLLLSVAFFAPLNDDDLNLMIGSVSSPLLAGCLGAPPPPSVPPMPL